MERRGIQWYKRPWFLLVIAAAILVLHYIGILRPIESVMMSVMQPVQGWLFQSSVGLSSNENDQQNVEQLTEQQQKEIYALQVENARLKAIVQQSQVLGDQLAFLQQAELRSVQAKITSKSTDKLAHTVMINRGTNDGIEKGDAVIIENGILVGVVHDVQATASSVLLLTSFNAKISATVQNAQQSPGIVQGDHNISLRLTFVPQTDTLAVGDTIVSSGNDEHIPPDLVIGSIQEIFQQPGSLFQEASLTPLFDLSQLSIVSVITL